MNTRLPGLLTVVMSASLLACGDTGGGSTSQADTLDSVTDTMDALAIDGIDDAIEDLTTTDVAVDAPVEPALVLGANVVLQHHPSAFTELTDGDHLEIELGGFNGLWMVVLAFKTRGYFPGRVIVFADVSVNGEEISSLSLSKQDLIPADDGWDYYYDLFLIANDTSVGGQEAIVDLTVRDYENQEFEVSLQSKLLVVGGDPPYWP